MSSEYIFDDSGKVNAKQNNEPEGAQKDNSPLTLDQVKGPLDASTVARMQQTMGNQAVQRALLQRSGDGGGFDLDEDTSAQINSSRGSGTSLDSNMADRAGQTMGQDFSNVNVHNDSNAADLSDKVNAKAFTIGNDIFFNEGQYNPNSSDGQELIAHELTHVAQQGAAGGAVQAKLSVNDPNDSYEQEADAVASKVMAKEDESTRQVQREDVEEREEQLTRKPMDLQREGAQDGEEEMRLKPMDLQRNDMENVEEREEQITRKPLDLQRDAEREE